MLAFEAAPSEVCTVHHDDFRANVRVTGNLDHHAAATLASVTAEHLRAGRHYMRLDFSRVSGVDDTALAVLSDLHRRLLASRGTLIVTGVSARLERALATASAPLFLLPTSAADQLV